MPSHVVKDFQNLGPINLGKVRKFLCAHGPLTKLKKDINFYSVHFEVFEEDWRTFSDSEKAEIRLTGKPGGYPVFAPASLLDYIYLLSCKKLSSRLCANPRCDKSVQKSNQKYCSTKGPGNCRNKVITMMNQRSLDVFGISWREARKAGRKPIELGFGDVSAALNYFDVIED